MEKTRNSIIDLFKNFGFVISKLVNGGEVDDVELTGELAKDPMEALKEYETSVKAVEEPVQTKTRVRTQTLEVSNQPHSQKTVTKNFQKQIQKTVDDNEPEM